jgi:GNAT superfamily N-acetyltransferase
MSVLIRPLGPDDEAQWRVMWRGYLDFYQTALDEDVTALTFHRLCEDQRYYARLAETGAGVIGFVHCVFHPATWSKTDYCYLEDLYVSDAARGAGAGRKLIEAVYAECDRRDCERVYWLTHKDNQTARSLYDKLATLSDFVQYRRE